MEKIKKLKSLLKEKKIDGYMITKNDEFFVEYVPENKDRLKYISNFSGSFGFAIILKNINYLFVDGRYTLQAQKECSKYFKIITFPDIMPKNIFKNQRKIIAFDSKLITKKFLGTFFNGSKIKFLPLKENLIDKIWKRKEKHKVNKFYLMPENSINKKYELKLKQILLNLKRKNADYQFISASENNAWLFNIRGKDTDYALCLYAIV